MAYVAPVQRTCVFRRIESSWGSAQYCSRNPSHRAGVAHVRKLHFIFRMAGQSDGIGPARLNPKFNQHGMPARCKNPPEFNQKLHRPVIENGFLRIRGIQCQAELLNEVQATLVFGRLAAMCLQLFL